jgi:hypothetical protein
MLMAAYNPSLENQQGAAIVVTILAAIFCIRGVWFWYSEIQFYKNIGWDFSKDSGRSFGDFLQKKNHRKSFSFVSNKYDIFLAIQSE